MTEFLPETDIETLVELVTMPHYKVLKRRLEKQSNALMLRLRRSSDSLMDLVYKESNAARLDELVTFFRRIENDVEKWQRESE